jgi:hypothetical protein
LINVNAQVFTGDKPTGWEQAVQEVDGVELPGDTVEAVYIIVTLQAEDALKRKDDLERKLLAGRVRS